MATGRIGFPKKKPSRWIIKSYVQAMVFCNKKTENKLANYVASQNGEPFGVLSALLDLQTFRWPCKFK